MLCFHHLVHDVRLGHDLYVAMRPHRLLQQSSSSPGEQLYSPKLTSELKSSGFIPYISLSQPDKLGGKNHLGLKTELPHIFEHTSAPSLDDSSQLVVLFFEIHRAA